MPDTLILESHGAVALIRLNRPEALNALNQQLMSELAETLQAMDRDDAVRCIVITGSEKAFAAGADIREMAGKSFAEAFVGDIFGPEAEAIQRIRKPIIAAVAGFALGGGCELAMMCDFILAADTAKFGQPEINLGIIAGMGGTLGSVAILVALVQAQSLATMAPGPGVLAFGAVVVLSMLATMAFDPRLLWDIKTNSKSEKERRERERTAPV